MEGENSRHVMVLTYPAQGHINPLLQFTKLMASKGIKATLATTRYTASAIQAPGITIEPISDGFDEGGFKQASSLQAYLHSFKVIGSKSLTELIEKFKSSCYPVDCLVYDSLLPWALDVAKEMGVCKAAFLTNSASVCSLYWYLHHGLLSLPLTPDSFPLVLPGLPDLRSSDLPSFIAHPLEFSEYLGSIMEQFSTLEENDWVFINTFAELESEIDKAMSEKWPLKMVGPMLPSAYLGQQMEDREYGGSLWNQATENCLRWLDTKPSNSVIYISFGSMAEIPGKQVEELAWGLKNLESPFLWVFRESDKKLPPEFLTSHNDEVGIVVSWCNQLEVLAHRATCCFITHCGWNSMLEGLSLGVPMLAIPQWSDQPMNAKMMEDVWKLGV
ncbi:UDP-glycosyltransferase 74B1-like [Chenopodium quinoa]|uniref:UDP-glycosyltransferase 74B1-like n=1 Tax=Chenopodium quinoa TaxID=63459 RepID=UPI000B773C25|nr:UDP-glycosyltransferase 74B1-like [Chenopodium quinoa]